MKKILFLVAQSCGLVAASQQCVDITDPAAGPQSGRVWEQTFTACVGGDSLFLHTEMACYPFGGSDVVVQILDQGTVVAEVVGVEVSTYTPMNVYPVEIPLWCSTPLVPGQQYQLRIEYTGPVSVYYNAQFPSLETAFYMTLVQGDNPGQVFIDTVTEPDWDLGFQLNISWANGSDVEPEESFLCTLDCDGDGYISVIDLNCFMGAYGGFVGGSYTPPTSYPDSYYPDTDGDGTVGVTDLQYFISLYGQPCP